MNAPDPAEAASARMGQTKFVGLTCGIIVAGVSVALMIDELEVGGCKWGVSLELMLTGGMTTSARFRWVHRLDHHLVHPAW